MLRLISMGLIALSFAGFSDCFGEDSVFEDAGVPTESDRISLDRNRDYLWWYDLNAPSFGSSASADIDNDGYLEIVFGTYFNDETIHALNAEDGTLLWSYDTGGCNDASPVIYDVDQDGDLEVVIPASSPCVVYCFDGSTGNVEWFTSTYPYCIDSPPAVADVDNDGRPEIVFGAFYGYVYCLNGEDGSTCWQINLGTNSYIQSCPNILDCDDDGQLDVVVAQWAGDCRIYALRGNDGSVLWFSDAPEDYMYHGGSFADIDEDGRPEIVIGCYDGDVYALNAEDGSLAWEYTGVLYVGAPTSIADLNNDGHLEIVFVSYVTLKVLSHTGSLLWSYGTGGSIFRGAAISDVDGDGTLDVVFGSDDGILRALRGSDGQLIWSYNLEAHYGRTFDIDHAPVIADLNNDGFLDVFIIGGYGTSSQPASNHGRAYAVTGGNGTGQGWPMFRHDPTHSACFAGIEYSVTVTITPYNPPIIIPASGGSFEYNIEGANNGSAPVTVDVWCDVTLPSGSQYGPTLGPVTITLSAGQALNRDRTQSVPGGAPAGDYTYHAYIGDYPDDVWSEDSFAFEKMGVDGSGLDGWANGGEEFPGEFVSETPIPADFILAQNYPNPFNPTTKIHFALPAASRVSLRVYNTAGQLVTTLLDGYRQAGWHEVTWNASGLSTGLYVYRFEAGGKTFSRKAILVK